MALVAVLLALLAYLAVLGVMSWRLRAGWTMIPSLALACVTALFAAAVFGIGRGSNLTAQPREPLEVAGVASAVLALMGLYLVQQRLGRRALRPGDGAGVGIILVLLAGVAGVLADIL